MLWLNCSWTKHSCCIPKRDCKFIACIESLNSLEQEWFWMSALKNIVMPVLLKRLSDGNPSATWLIFSKIVLERKVWSCRGTGWLLQTVVIFKTTFLSYISARVLLFSSGHINKWKQKKSAAFALLSSHLSLLVFTQKGACPVRSCIFHIPALRAVLIRLLCACFAELLKSWAGGKKKRKGKIAKDSKEE